MQTRNTHPCFVCVCHVENKTPKLVLTNNVALLLFLRFKILIQQRVNRNYQQFYEALGLRLHLFAALCRIFPRKKTSTSPDLFKGHDSCRPKSSVKHVGIQVLNSGNLKSEAGKPSKPVRLSTRLPAPDPAWAWPWSGRGIAAGLPPANQSSPCTPAPGPAPSSPRLFESPRTLNTPEPARVGRGGVGGANGPIWVTPPTPGSPRAH